MQRLSVWIVLGLTLFILNQSLEFPLHAQVAFWAACVFVVLNILLLGLAAINGGLRKWNAGGPERAKRRQHNANVKELRRLDSERAAGVERARIEALPKLRAIAVLAGRTEAQVARMKFSELLEFCKENDIDRTRAIEAGLSHVRTDDALRGGGAQQAA